ncbi:phosphoserine phosphatase SerB [Devosia crocina]|uniref:Phosphoserine phosphatase n=2 Tax=Devosia crocina TaxID=429728 RepID=A0A1I7N783_9HYPH|nr:phosphoserine phosphatase SerB [Devosia crocina]
MHRKGTSNPLRVGHPKAPGYFRIHFHEHRHAASLIKRLELLLNLQGQLGRDLGNFGESVYQGIEIEPCSADENHLALDISMRKNFRYGTEPLAGRKASAGGHRAIKTMLSAPFVLSRRPRRNHAHGVIDLHGISVDDETTALLSPRQRQPRLAAGGGTRYQDGASLARHSTLPKDIVAMPVLSLIANPADSDLDVSLAAAVVQQTGGELNWLSHQVACDIIEPKAPDALAIARDLIGQRRVDANIVPTDGRRKLLLIADMDSTMIEQECIDELAAALDLKPQVAEITERAMRGELDFGAALDTRVALLKGLERATIEAVRREAITLTPGGRTLVHTMKAYGAYTSLVSGGFTFFADYFAKRIGFDEAVANVLLFEGEQLTGTVRKPIVDKDTKRIRLETLAAERGLSLGQTLAVGDGANDLDMIGIAGFGVALHAKPAVSAAAAYRVDHGDLTALLYLQGYEEDEFVR